MTTILMSLVIFSTNVCDIDQCISKTAIDVETIASIRVCHANQKTACIYTKDGKRYYVLGKTLEEVIEEVNRVKKQKLIPDFLEAPEGE